MDTQDDTSLRRTSSRTSNASASSQGGWRSAGRKLSTPHSRSTSELEDKSLTSFPSLSPEASPNVQRQAAAAAAGGVLGHSMAAVMAPPATPPRSTRAASASTPPTTIDDATPITARKHRASAVETLVKSSPSFRGQRSALFEDSPGGAGDGVPAALHANDDDAIRRLIARTGAVRLVRQLAQDLAQRDLEIAGVRRRADTRERELKRMLREVEVSNLDIERRLRRLDAVDDPLKHERGGERPVGDGLGDLMQEALTDELGGSEGGYLGAEPAERDGAERGEDNEATLKAKTKDAKSAGWKGMLFNGTGGGTRHSRANSTATDSINDAEDGRPPTGGGAGDRRRKPVGDLTFKPPTQDEQDSESGQSKSDKRAPSISSWTMSLFGGKPPPGKGDKQPSLRGRGDQTSQSSTRDTSQASGRTASSAQAALLRVKESNPPTRDSTARRTPAPLLQTGAAKSSAALSAQSLPPNSPASMTSGPPPPVEMDAILPAGTRPPTLSPHLYNQDDASEPLTDRFGFIYDQRRRKKEAEAFARMGGTGLKSKQEMLSSSKDSGEGDSYLDAFGQRPASPASISSTKTDPRKWQDYFKVATFPTELLAHTPSSGNIMTLGHPDMKSSLRRSTTFDQISAATPPKSALNPIPSTTNVLAEPAGTASPNAPPPLDLTSAPPKTELEPVKLLLTQLTELHDSLQRDREIKWNEFLRKVRAERQRAGEAVAEARPQATDTPEAALMDGEIIGIATHGNTGKVGRAKYKEFKILVLGGIPISLRAKIWSECSGASSMRIPGYYEELVANDETDDPVVVSQIEADIYRTLTDNVFFRRGPGTAKLSEVLRAYARRNPEVGYCQGMNLITASLLLIMPTAEDAFWVLASAVEAILPRHYYDNSLLASRADQQVLRQYVGELLPRLSAHLEALGVELEALTFQWFLSLFTDCLSAEALYRVWDVLLCTKDEEGNGGSTFLFQVALALLKLNEAQLLACDAPGEIYAYLGSSITNHAISIDGLIGASDSLRAHVRRAEVEERRARCVAVELETLKERDRIRNEVNAKGESGKKKARGI